jgi:hypothetical protein
VTGPEIIQLPKTGEKEVATDEGADAVQASSPEFNPKPTQSNVSDAGTNAAITAKEANERAPDEKAESVKAAPPEFNQKLTKPGENDAATKASAAEAKDTNDDGGTVSQREVSQPPSVDQMVLDLKRKIAVAAESKSSDATAEGSVEENKSSDATAAKGRLKKTSHRMLQPKGRSKKTSHRILQPKGRSKKTSHRMLQWRGRSNRP